MDSIKGIKLFNDVEDPELRNRNRAVVMANMFEDHMDETKRVSKQGLALILEYFTSIPQEERADAYAGMFIELDKRGLATKH